MKIQMDRESAATGLFLAAMIAAPIALVIIAAAYPSFWTIAAAIVGSLIVSLLLMTTHVEWSYTDDDR